MILDSITVTASQGTVNSRVLASSAADLEAGNPTLAGPVEIRWSRAASMLPPEPTEVTVHVLTPVDDPRVDLDINTRLTITWGKAGTAATVFDGFTDSITWHPPEGRRVNGRRVQEVEITAICPIGRRARQRVGDEPWPASSSTRRRMLIGRDLMPEFDSNGMTVPDITQPPNTDDRYTWAAHLDIDSRSPVEVLQELLNAHRQILTPGTSPERPTIVAQRVPTRSRGTLVHSGGTVTLTAPSSMSTIVDIDARYADDTTRSRSFDSGLSAVTVEYELGDQSYYPTRSRMVSRTWGDLNSPGTSVRIKQGIVSLQYNPAGTDESFEALVPEDPPQAGFYAAMVRPFDRNTTRLGPVRIPLSRLPDTAAPILAALTDLNTRWGTDVRLDNAPAGVPPVHFPLGGALILSGDPDQCELTLDLEPAEFLTAPSVLWRDFGHAAAYPLFSAGAFTYDDAALASEVTT